MPGPKRFPTVLSLAVLLSVLLSACHPSAAWTTVAAPLAQAPTSAATAAPAPTVTQAPAATRLAPVETAAPAASPAPFAGSKTVEVFSSWAAGGEAAGLDALVKAFNAQYPEVAFANPAAAAPGDPDPLAARLQANQPPDSWQARAGQALDIAQVQPLDGRFPETGWQAALPPSLLPLLSRDGHLYALPVSVRRANLLWYNIPVLIQSGVSVPTNLDEWFAAMDTLKGQGITPLALGDPSTALLLMENVFLSALGPEKYSALWSGQLGWESPEVGTALATFQRVLSYTNGGAASLTGQDAARRVANGEAAFTVMADWAESAFKELGKTPKQDFGWAPMPGTAGVFLFLADALVLPVNPPHPEEAAAWMSIVASKEGQDAFNPSAGSIPARTDANPDLYDPYQRSALADWAKDILVEEQTSVMVPNDAWKTGITGALTAFLQDRDIAAFQSQLVEACEASGPCQ